MFSNLISKWSKICTKILIFNDFDEKQPNQELSTQNSRLWRVWIDLIISVWKIYQRFKDFFLFQLMPEPNTKISLVQSTQNYTTSRWYIILLQDGPSVHLMLWHSPNTAILIWLDWCWYHRTIKSEEKPNCSHMLKR